MKAIKLILGVIALAAIGFLIVHFLKINEIKSVMNENIVIMNHYAEAIGTATTPEKMAAATSHYAAEVRRFGTKLKDLKNKYPEISQRETAPAMLKETIIEHEDAVKNLMSVSRKLSPYMENQQVKDAYDDLIQAWIETK